MSDPTTAVAETGTSREVRPNPGVPLSRDFTGDLIARFLRQDASRMACIAQDVSWTYADLHRASAVIARKIGASSADRSRPVVIYARRHPVLVAAILGI